MSLLNEMLNDLQTNKKTRLNPIASVLKEKRPLVSHITPWFIWFIATIIVSFILLGLSHWSSLSYQKPVVAVSIPSLPILPVHLEQPSVAAPVQPLLSTVLPIPVLPTPSLQPVVTAAEVDPFLIDTDKRRTEQVSTNLNPLHKVFAHLSPKEWRAKELNRALDAVQAGDETGAIDILDEILFKFPTDIEARESLAAIYLSRADLTEAMRTLDAGLQLNPSAFNLNTMKARLLFEQDRPEDALTLLKHFSPDIHHEPDFYGLLAAVLQTLGKTNEAGSLYKSLVKLDSTNGQYWLGYGLALEDKQAYQQAMAAYRRATESQNMDPSVRAYAENRLKTLQG